VRRSAWRVRSSGDSPGGRREGAQFSALERHHDVSWEDSGRPQANLSPSPPPPQRSSRPCPPSAVRLHLIRQLLARRTQRPLAAIPDSAPAAAPETAIIDLIERFLTLDEALHRAHDLLQLRALGWGAETPPGSDQVTIIVAPSAAPAIVTRWGTDAGKLLHLVEHLLGPSRCKPCQPIWLACAAWSTWDGRFSWPYGSPSSRPPTPPL